MLEGAFVSGAFLFILIAAIDFGQVMFSHQTLTERARAAARWGAAHHADPDLVVRVQNLVLYNSVSAPDQNMGAPGLFGMNRSNIIVTRAPGPYGQPDRLTVRVTAYTFPFFTPLIAGRKVGNDIIVSLPMENP